MRDSPPRPARPDRCADERDWRLLPTVSDRQLVTVVGFVAAIAYLAAGLLAIALLLHSRLGHTWPVIIATAGLGAGTLLALLGLAIRGLLGWRARRRNRLQGNA